MGIIVDKDKVEKNSCRCYKLEPNSDLLCFKEGIVGVLTPEQEKKYCELKTVDKDTKKLETDIRGISKDLQSVLIGFDEPDEDIEKLIRHVGKKYNLSLCL